MDARVYKFSVPTGGAYADRYTERYGRVYGDFLLDTNYTFDAAVNEVMRSLPFNGCADVQEQDTLYSTAPGYNTDYANDCKFSAYGEVTYLLYNGTATIKMTVETPRYSSVRYGLPALPQFHDADGKATKSDNVLLYYIGEYTLPAGEPYNPVCFRKGTFYDSVLTGGKRIYNISPSTTLDGSRITSIPLFRRWYYNDNMQLDTPSKILDFGTPKAHATGGSAPTTNVYNDYWKWYLWDRFNRDAVVMTASVDFSGIPVSQELLREFFYYRGARWSLNKIIDYNPANPGDLVKCEFVRVLDTYDYTGIQ